MSNYALPCSGTTLSYIQDQFVGHIHTMKPLTGRFTSIQRNVDWIQSHFRLSESDCTHRLADFELLSESFPVTHQLIPPEKKNSTGLHRTASEWDCKESYQLRVVELFSGSYNSTDIDYMSAWLHELAFSFAYVGEFPGLHQDVPVFGHECWQCVLLHIWVCLTS